MAQDNYVAPSLLASGATWAQLLANGLDGMVGLLIAANPPIANPTVAITVNPTGGGATGGLLPAGNYFVSMTWLDGAGETTIGTSRSTSFAVGSTNIPQITVPAIPAGASQYNIYLTKAGGAAGTETTYVTGATGTTYNLPYAGANDPTQTIPAANTTGAAAIQGMLNEPIPDLFQRTWNRFTQMVDNYTSGYPVNFQNHRDILNQQLYGQAFRYRMAQDLMALITANPGTLRGSHANELVIARPYRSFP